VLTSFECQERADQKRAEAELHPRNGQRLLTAAEGWLILAGIMRRLEARRPCSTGATEPETCHETAVVTYWAACRGARFPLVVEGHPIYRTDKGLGVGPRAEHMESEWTHVRRPVAAVWRGRWCASAKPSCLISRADDRRGWETGLGARGSTKHAYLVGRGNATHPGGLVGFVAARMARRSRCASNQLA
jgi:hypothetical protein